MADRIRQVSAPRYNQADDRWYNRERILEPDGQGSYFVREETVYRSHDGDSSTGLPEPWQENVSRHLSSLIPPVLLSSSRRGKLVAAFPFVAALGAMERNENPLSGTIL